MGGYFGGGADLVARALATTAYQDGPLPLVAGGTVDAITAPFPSGITALHDLQSFAFESTGANTGPVTLDIGGTGALSLVHIGGAQLVAGDIPAAGTLIEVFPTVDHLHYHVQLIRQPSTATPLAAAGAGAVGTSTRFARGDHVHPAGASGALVYLSTVTASASATVDVETGFGAAYDDYLIVFSTTQSDNAVGLRALLKIGGSYVVSGYNEFVGVSVTGFANTSEQATYILLNNNGGNTAGFATHGQVNIFSANSTSLQKMITWNAATVSGAPAFTHLLGAARNTGTAALTGMRFYTATGTLTGTFKLYGIAKA